MPHMVRHVRKVPGFHHARHGMTCHVLLGKRSQGSIMQNMVRLVMYCWQEGPKRSQGSIMPNMVRHGMYCWYDREPPAIMCPVDFVAFAMV